MKIEFDDNEFTSWDLLEYLRRAYGVKINGLPFSIFDIHNWLRLKKLPDTYGGNKILGSVHYKQLENLRVITVKGLSRSDIEAAYGLLSDFEEHVHRFRKIQKVEKHTLPDQQKTPLYYKLLKWRSPSLVVQKRNGLPTNWKEMGIKGNQVIEVTKKIRAAKKLHQTNKNKKQ